MQKKFAIIEAANSVADITYRFKIIGKSPVTIQEWYVKKFNPFKMEEVEHCGQRGFLIKLPFTKDGTFIQSPEALSLTTRTLEALSAYGVEMVLPPPVFAHPFPNTLPVADGCVMRLFFAMPIIQKALHFLNKDIKTAEILIIGGNMHMTLLLIDMVYPHVNHLTLLTDNPEDTLLLETAERVFDDTGLNLCLTVKNKALLEGADVILNTYGGPDRYDFYYRRGAAYVEFSPNKQKYLELATKRPELLLVDDIKIKYRNQVMSAAFFEMLFFAASAEYRRFYYFLGKNYSEELSKFILQELKVRNAQIRSFCHLGQVVKQTKYCQMQGIEQIKAPLNFTSKPSVIKAEQDNRKERKN